MASLLLIYGLLGTGTTVLADRIKEADVFADAQWNFLTKWTMDSKKGVVQSMCETEQYIVCYQDVGVKGKPDIITVFDRYSYELLFEIKDMDYEHGNGMTYNPNTNQIYIAPYTTKTAENSGCIFVLDADTLAYKYKIRVSDGSWEASAIEYVEGRNQYIIQTNIDGDFAFHVYDADFNWVEYLFPGDRSLDNRFQDFCVSGDYIISLPYMGKNKHDSRLQLYSISNREYLGSYSLRAPGAGERYEPESICQSESGEIVVSIALSGTRQMALYNTYVPVVYSVNTAVENGEITPSKEDVDIGRDYKVKYSSTEDYELKEMQVDGADVDIKEHPTSYTFGNIQNDHSIWVKFTEIPKFEITTAAANGSIEPAQLIRRDQDVTINYKPDVHYEIDTLLIDGKEVDPTEYEGSYTFEFIQGPHSVNVSYKEIPSFTISTEVYNGRITETNKKVYRDENYRVKYEPDEGYKLAYMQVDGKWLEEIATKTQSSTYSFTNIQEGHDVLVVFQWKYMSLAIIGGAFGACVPMCMIYLLIMRRRKRISRRRTGNK